MHRKKIIEGNTRNTANIKEQDEYIENSTLIGSRADLAGIKPIYSIIKHYPPDWKKQLQ